jgi:hypothetical protein
MVKPYNIQRYISQIYVQYVHRHNSCAVLVFDGYGSGPSTKDETHFRRASPKYVGAEVDVKPEMYLTMKKKAFLANPKNKQKFFFYWKLEGEKWHYSAS